MSLEATHIRFAVDLKDKYGVSDLSKYIPGSIYPDSRYFTGIDRQLIHPQDYLDWDLGTDDFKKGWAAHLLCDDLCIQITKEILPSVFEGTSGHGNDIWIKHTAIKILQDIDDMKKFDLNKYISYLEHIENPNGENPEEMRKYHQIFLDMYAKLNEVGIDSHYAMWGKLRLDKELTEKLKIQTEAFSNDEAITKAIPLLYPAMLSRAQ